MRDIAEAIGVEPGKLYPNLNMMTELARLGGGFWKLPEKLADKPAVSREPLKSFVDSETKAAVNRDIARDIAQKTASPPPPPRKKELTPAQLGALPEGSKATWSDELNRLVWKAPDGTIYEPAGSKNGKDSWTPHHDGLRG